MSECKDSELADIGRAERPTYAEIPMDEYEELQEFVRIAIKLYPILKNLLEKYNGRTQALCFKDKQA